MVEFLELGTRRIAYNQLSGEGPGIVFLPGLRSDMEGTKALFLEDWARERGRAFLRFDYTGHGQSSGDFTEGCIGDWARDAAETIAELTSGPQIIVGSSMGGWIGLLLARDAGLNISAMVGLAAAPDFTKNGMWAEFTDEQKAELETRGYIEEPSEYGEPMVISKRLIEDGWDRLVLESPLAFDFPLRLIQGTADADVPMDWALRLLEHVECDDARLQLIKDADHRLSSPRDLEGLARTLDAL
ncbi:alpha/beta hydrolase [Paracoccaceae bacterium GXU_MW_L88]